MSRRIAAPALWAALTFSCAVLVHGAVHAAGDRSFALGSLAHALMVTVALGLLAAVAVPLGLAGPPAERRRRLALVRAALPLRRGPGGLMLGTVAQGAIAVALQAAEGGPLAPDRPALALLSGVVALVLTALILRGSPRRIVAFLVALAAPGRRRDPSSVDRELRVRPPRRRVPFRLFVPNRPPPAAA